MSTVEEQRTTRFIYDTHIKCVAEHARGAQAEDSLHAELAARGAALADADRRFAELEALLQRLAARANAA